MKKISKIICIILVFLLCNSSIFAYEKDGEYICEYNNSPFRVPTDKNGNIYPMYSAGEIKKLVDSGKCAFKPNTYYICTFPKGSCSFSIYGNGHRYKCKGKVPNMRNFADNISTDKRCKKQ